MKDYLLGWVGLGVVLIAVTLLGNSLLNDGCVVHSQPLASGKQNEINLNPTPQNDASTQAPPIAGADTAGSRSIGVSDTTVPEPRGVVSDDDVAAKGEVGTLNEASVEQVVTLSKGLDCRSRIKMLNELRNPLPDEDREALVQFLKEQRVPEGMKEGEFHWLADEIFILLRKQNPPVEDLSLFLADLVMNPRKDPVLQDYALQHAGHLSEETGDGELLEKIIWEGTLVETGTVAGSALLSAWKAIQDGRLKPGSKDRLLKEALSMLRNDRMSLSSRVTALAVLGEAFGQTANSTAYNIIIKDNQPLLLRMAAAGVLSRSDSGKSLLIKAAPLIQNEKVSLTIQKHLHVQAL
jgi:hypothetical protein